MLTKGDSQQIQHVLLTVLKQADAVGYAGYSKFDGLRSPVTQMLSFGWWPLRLLWTQLVMRAPIDLRPALRIKRGVNPEAPALFAQANLNCVEIGISGTIVKRARWCLDWLVEHSAPNQNGYHGRCWGYHHAWQSPGFYQPPHYPNCYITAIVGAALLDGYLILQEEKYLDAVRSAADFILCDLPVFHEDDEEKSIAYVPTMRMQLRVININALAGALLARVGAITAENHLLEQARKLMTFVVRQQTSYGAWHYTVNPKHSLVTHDNYHTGMILDALLCYEQATSDSSFQQNFMRGLDFYRHQLFLSDGAPKWTNDHVWPHDVHGSAQGTLTFALAGDLEMALRIAKWGIDHFYKGNGEFAYQQGRFIKKRFTLLHWCNGWMARALGALVMAQHNQQRDKQ